MNGPQVDTESGMNWPHAVAEILSRPIATFQGVPDVPAQVFIKEYLEVIHENRRLKREVARLQRANDAKTASELIHGASRRDVGIQTLQRLGPLALATRMPLTLVFTDDDGLKWVNDTYGHGAGDNKLRTTVETLEKLAGGFLHQAEFLADSQVAQLILARRHQRSPREPRKIYLPHDLRRTSDFISAWAGDEFAAVLPGYTATDARRLLSEFRREIEASQVGPAFSFGVARLRTRGQLEPDPANPSQPRLVSQADRSMYTDKSRRQVARIRAGATVPEDDRLIGIG